MIATPQQIHQPHSEECERAVLSAVMLDPKIFDELNLLPEDFFEKRNETIFRACQHLRDQQRPLDSRTMQDTLEAWGAFDRVGGHAYLAKLDDDLPDLGRVSVYAGVVKERANRRRAIRIAGEIIRAAHDGEVAIKEQLGTAASQLDGLIEERSTGDFVPMRQAVEELGHYVDQERKAVHGALTGIKAIDDRTIAMEGGQFWLVAARPGIGKTALMLQSVEQAIVTGRRVAIVSLEMRRIELLMRLVAKRSHLPFHAIRRRSLNSREHARFTYAQRELQHAAVWIDDTSGGTVEEITAKIRTLKRTHGIDEAWLDYLTLIDHARSGRQDLDIDRIANRLAGLAKDQEIPVIALGQLGKRGEFEKRPPILADLKDAGEAPAYGVLLLHRESHDHNRSLFKPEGTITIAKNRGGEQGEVLTWFDGATMTWRERDLNHGEQP